MQDRLLVIDDDVELFGLLQRFLKREGFQAESAATAAAGLEKVAQTGYSLIVLDVMLPDKSGFEALRSLRASGIETPVLMLTARGDTHDRVRGLEMGADDYLAKPFDPSELAARIRAILRRARVPAERSIVMVDDIEVDSGSRTVRRNGEIVALTTVEFDLLAALVRTAGSVVSRELLALDVLGRDFSPFDRSIDTHVYNLRRKLGPLDDGTERIKGVRGTGYLYVWSGNSQRRR
jgi:two-component system response regulator CpxR